MIAAITVPFWSNDPSRMIPHWQSVRAILDHIPNIFGRIAEFPARDARTQAKVANADGVVLDVVGKVVLALGHRTDKHADASLRSQVRDVVCHSHHFCVIAERDFATIHRKVIGDGVLDHLQQFFLRIGGADGQPVQQLHHQSSESLEGTGYSNTWADLDEDSLRGVDVYLKFSSLVDGRVEESQKTL